MFNPVRMVIAGLCLSLLAVQVAHAFGQNKVQYHSLDWSYYQTEHFDVYFNQDGAMIGEFAARHLESMYEEVAEMVGHRLSGRVPVILHNTHTEFQQTNVIPFVLPEGVGGFTERFKNRVVMPFEGSYRDFYHVLQHELVHAVVFDMLFRAPSTSQGSFQGQFGGFPLWVNEGLAEYTALGWDLGSEFFMIDATTFGYVTSPVHDFGGFLAYKGGQLFFHFLESVYGKGTTTRFIRNLARSGNTFEAFRRTTGTSLEEAGEVWLRELRYLYWPELGQRQYGLSTARRLTQRGRDRSFYNLQPSISPDGKEIAFFSDREIWEAIYVLNVETEEVARAVVQSGREGHHESFRSFKSGIAWSPDGKELAIVSKRGGRDVIHIIDAASGRVRRELQPDVQAILSPDWSRDGRFIAFSGQKDGFADIYVYDLEADETRRLTHDIAHDDKPVFSPSGRWIVFESDRPRAVLEPGDDGPLAWFDSLLSFKDLYRISVEGDSISLMVGGAWDEKMPSFGPSDSQMVFVSNRSGLDNIYLWQDSAGVITERPLTNLLTGTFTPSWSRDGKRLAFSLFEAGGWDIYLMNDPLDKVMEGPLPKTRFIQHAEDSTAGFFRPIVLENLRSWRPDTAKAETAESSSGRRWRWFGWFRSDPSPSAEAASEAASKDEPDTVAVSDTAEVAEPVAASDTSDTSEAEVLEEGEPLATGAVREPRDETRFRRGDPFLRDSSLYLDADGNFIRRDYRTRWSFDGATAAVGVDNYYGAGGLGFINLSDLMGDHRAAVAFSINGSLQNISAYVDYAYLKHRLDLTLIGFHESQEWRFQTYWGADNAVYTNRTAGAGAGVRWPFSPFTRVEAGLLARYAERSIEQVVTYDTLGRPDSISREHARIDAFSPTVAWVHDNARWGIVGPVAGRRMLASAQYLPPVFQDENSYVRLNADLRTYKNLYKRYTFAFRLSGGMSEAVGGYANPHRFYVGGEGNTFNAYYNPDNVPGRTDIAQLYFSELDFPLRGYDFFEFAGTRKFLGNAEFRFPFVRELSFAWPLPFSIRHVMGNLFVDYGGAWSEGNPFDQLGLGYGYGMRLNLGIFVLKYTRAWPAMSRSDGGLSSRTYWSMGSEF